jgi:hypothetical protein
MSLKFRNAFRLIVALAILSVFTECHRYYMATTRDVKNHPDNSIESLKNENRYFILRTPNHAYYMGQIILSDDRKTLTCTLDSLPPIHTVYVDNKKGNKRYNEIYVLSEVHLYVPEDIRISQSSYTLPLDQIQKIEVLEKDRKRTTNSYVIGALGYTLGSIAVAAIIVAATKSSCPFVSANTGNEFELQGEIYGGAIYPQMARDDYMPLRVKPFADGSLKVKISNELKERQYTDFADLLVITHDKNTKVLSDEKGNLYSIKNCDVPVKASTGNYTDALPAILEAGDNRLLHFDDTLALNSNNNNVVVQFNKPENVQKAKLVLSVKNTYWLDYLYGEMAKGFGSYFTAYTRKQFKTPLSKLLKWTKDQKLPLEVSISTKDGWAKITDITTIGPLAQRQIVVPLDLTNLPGTSMQIRLSSGFMFWEIDYVGIDYSPGEDFQVENISPSIATDETGKNVLPQLIKKDGDYLEQPVPGNVVTLEYKCKPQSVNTARSYILHSRGYYIHVRDFKGAPDIAFLKQFKKADAFPAYSLQLYKKFRATSMEALVKQ